MSYRDDLKTQIRDAYGKLVYSYTCHWEHMNRVEKNYSCLRNMEVISTAITATGVISALVTSARCLMIISAIFSALSLVVTLLLKSNNYDEQMIKHRKTADDLWLIREEYISLLTDFNRLSDEEIAEKRDGLMRRSSVVYSSELPTDSKDYENAQRKLKNEEYQYFSDDEINKMLPKHLRLLK